MALPCILWDFNHWNSVFLCENNHDFIIKNINVATLFAFAVGSIEFSRGPGRNSDGP